MEFFGKVARTPKTVSLFCVFYGDGLNAVHWVEP